jgi:hypothetical protein
MSTRTDPKSDEFRCQILLTDSDSDAKFNMTIFFHELNFQSIRLKPNPLPSLHAGARRISFSDRKIACGNPGALLPKKGPRDACFIRA